MQLSNKSTDWSAVRKLNASSAFHTFYGVNSSIGRQRNDKFSFLCGATAQLSSKLHPSLTSILGAGDLSVSRPGRFTTTPQESGWAQCRSGRFWEHKNLLFLAAFEPRTDCATQAATAWQGVSLTLKFLCYWP